MAMAAKGWIEGDESAKEMLSRVLTDRPFLLLPPLHRLPLRVGNVVELVGPSPSAKTHILMQAAIDCILPKQWNGVHYGGLGRLAMFIDLDCRFDVLRLSQMLKHRIAEANFSGRPISCGQNQNSCDEELFAVCMRRFLYVRCYDSLEFLATLKTLHYELQKEKEAQQTTVHFLMIDSIGAFYWVDRALTSLSVGRNNRKGLSLQNLSETVVQEIKKILLVHPLLVIATKATILGDRNAVNEVKWKRKRPSSPDSSISRNLATNYKQQLLHREYMPSVWQSFVTHRILLQPTDDRSMYFSEWLLPPLGLVDNFVVKDQNCHPCGVMVPQFLGAQPYRARSLAVRLDKMIEMWKRWREDEVFSFQLSAY